MNSSSVDDIHVTAPFINNYEGGLNISSNSSAQNSNDMLHPSSRLAHDDGSSILCDDNDDGNGNGNGNGNASFLSNIDEDFTNLELVSHRCVVSMFFLIGLNMYQIMKKLLKTYISIGDGEDLISKLLQSIRTLRTVFLGGSLILFQIYIYFSLFQVNSRKEISYKILKGMIVTLLTMICGICISLLFLGVYELARRFSPLDLDVFHLDVFIETIIFSICILIVFISLLFGYKRKDCYKNAAKWIILISSIAVLQFIYVEKAHLIWIGIKRLKAYTDNDPNYAKIV
ncbi:hypothetical protein NEFER03_0298 [Nematocida sp. LUAm3]|nr:hypothetical protein NEFER03_0298 [Nematocida sp. LUAm3]KAI5173750.1 hypothetical protein NEFER02_0266 [Nematocida sp. LUAm2]KAI5176973.1 hypothetical protein NEFER01_0298 [Nematocida sp. LUAm1]